MSQLLAVIILSGSHLLDPDLLIFRESVVEQISFPIPTINKEG